MFASWNNMYNFDASSMIHVWDNYPIDNQHFEALWDWFANQVDNGNFVFSETAFIETNHKVPECGAWLKSYNLKIDKLSPDIIYQAQAIKTLLEIEEENYTTGVGENDILIVSNAKTSNSILITEESRQNNLPSKKSNYKIPAVCALNEVSVQCINFTELLKV